MRLNDISYFQTDYYNTKICQPSRVLLSVRFFIIINTDQQSMKDLFDFELDKKGDNGELWHAGSMFNAQPVRMAIPLPEQYQNKEQALSIFMVNEESQVKKISDGGVINPYQNLLDVEIPCKIQEKDHSSQEVLLEEKSNESYKIENTSKIIKKKTKRLIPFIHVPKRPLFRYHIKSHPLNISYPPLLNNKSLRYRRQFIKLSKLKKDKSYSCFQIYGNLYAASFAKQYQSQSNLIAAQSQGLSAKKSILSELIDSLTLQATKLEEKLSNKFDDFNQMERLQKRIYTCSFCGKSFDKASGLGGHISKVHPQNKKQIHLLNEDKQQKLERMQSKLKNVKIMSDFDDESDGKKDEIVFYD